MHTLVEYHCEQVVLQKLQDYIASLRHDKRLRKKHAKGKLTVKQLNRAPPWLENDNFLSQQYMFYRAVCGKEIPLTIFEDAEAFVVEVDHLRKWARDLLGQVGCSWPGTISTLG